MTTEMWIFGLEENRRDLPVAFKIFEQQLHGKGTTLILCGVTKQMDRKCTV